MRGEALGTFLLILLAGFGSLTADAADSLRKLEHTFQRPPREFATAPLWVWNDLLTEDQVRSTMRDLARQNVRQVFVHPRPGLATPYLSQDWFRLWKAALSEARQRDMNVWIYDENSYPSGFAGGWVPELMPESRGQGLHFEQTTNAPTWNSNIRGIWRLAGQKPEDVTGSVRSGTTLPAGHPYLVASIRYASPSPWHGGRSYVNLITPGVTERFLEVTLEAYKRHVGKEFGKRIPGAFTDEPEITPAGGWPWADDLPQQFQQRWGYDLITNLVSLKFEIGDWQRVRHNYFQILLDLFIERWAKPYYEWCDRNRLDFTGHYWEHEWPRCSIVPDNMAMAAWQHRPGIDTLMNQYAENTHAQFGNVRAVREIASVANQLGRSRTLCELYGAGGWDLRFEDMKRIGDWLLVLGVNTLDEHLSYISLRGARKRDHPQSFSYHEPWWEAYHTVSTYLTRVTSILCQGEQVNRILVLEPTTSAWMYQGKEDWLREMGDRFFNTLMTLEKAQVEYDLGCEDIIARHGAVRGKQFVVGQRSYDVVVLPHDIENLNGPTWKLLHEFIVAGGSILDERKAARRIDGRLAYLSEDDGPWAKFNQRWTKVSSETLPQELRRRHPTNDFTIERAPNDQGILFHQRRRLPDGEFVFLVNTSIQHPSSGSFLTTRNRVEEWDPHSGAVRPHASTPAGAQSRAEFSLPPSGSLLLCLTDRTPPSGPKSKPNRATAASPASTLSLDTLVPPTKTAAPRRVAPNVLTLDHVDLTIGSKNLTNLYFYRAQQLAFQHHGMDRNPWDSAVQFRDEFIRKSFPADSGFSATYRFEIDGPVPRDLAIVIERPDLYAISCNGQTVHTKPGEWWLDKAFGKISLAHCARSGHNEVTLQARPFTIFHELEAAYLLGDFTLASADRGWIVKPAQTLDLRPWNEQGLPFYAEGVSYRQTFQVKNPKAPHAVKLGEWLGSVAKVTVNGKQAGYIGWAPWSLDVTRHLRVGANDIEITVIGTLKNTLGPHHGKPGLGSAWPGMFQRAPEGGLPPGREYHTVGYGLRQPFTLVTAPGS